MQKVKQDETAFQTKCFQWFWNSYPEHRGLLWHTPNGGKRSKREAARLKYMGVVPGIPDLSFLWRGRLYAFELKVEGGELSEEQENIRDLWREHGVEIREVRQFEAFQQEIRNVMLLGRHCDRIVVNFDEIGDITEVKHKTVPTRDYERDTR